MEAFTMIVLFVCLLVFTSFAVWIILQCKCLFTGIITRTAAIAGSYGLYLYAAYIAEAVIWGFRFAVIIAILAFILGINPFKKSGTTGG